MPANVTEEQLYKELKELYPRLTHEELIEAGQNLDIYIDHVVSQFERIRKDPAAYSKFLALTGWKPAQYDDDAFVLPAKLQPPTCLEK
jgi:hypothetical protein